MAVLGYVAVQLMWLTPPCSASAAGRAGGEVTGACDQAPFSLGVPAAQQPSTAQALVLHQGAAVLHHLQPRRLGLGQGFVMAHTNLQPQGPGADGIASSAMGGTAALSRNTSTRSMRWCFAASVNEGPAALAQNLGGRRLMGTMRYPCACRYCATWCGCRARAWARGRRWQSSWRFAGWTGRVEGRLSAWWLPRSGGCVEERCRSRPKRL